MKSAFNSKEDIELLAKGFHFHNFSNKFLDWIETRWGCEVCYYKRTGKHKHYMKNTLDLRKKKKKQSVLYNRVMKTDEEYDKLYQYCNKCKRVTGTDYLTKMCGGCILKHTLDLRKKKKKKDWGATIATGVGIIFIAYLLAHLIVAIDLTKIAHAQVEVSVSIPCNNLNWERSPDCYAPVETFEVDPITRNATGKLTSGKEFTQTWYTDNLMVFRMDSVCWITNGHTTVYCL